MAGVGGAFVRQPWEHKDMRAACMWPPSVKGSASPCVASPSWQSEAPDQLSCMQAKMQC